MKQNHGWNIEEIENMYPWERDIYFAMLNNHIEEENQRLEAQNKKYG